MLNIKNEIRFTLASPLQFTDINLTKLGQDLRDPKYKMLVKDIK